MTAEGEATHLRSWRIHSFAAKQTSVVLWSRLTKTCRFLSPSYPIGPMRIDPTDEQVVLPLPPPENERERLISSRLTVNHMGKLRAARPFARFLPSPLSLFSQLESNVPSNSDRKGAAFVCPSIPALALLASSAPVGKIIMKRRDNHSHSLLLLSPAFSTGQWTGPSLGIG